MKLFALSLCFLVSFKAAAEQYVIIHRPGKNFAKADEFKAEDSIPGHIHHYSRLRSEGRIYAGGPFMDGAGGMMIAAEGETQEFLEAFAKADPAVKSQILEAEVHPWRPAMRPAEVKYYFGTVTYYEADGKTINHATSSLIKRITSPIDETIVEYQATPNKDKTKAGQQFLVHLKRIAGTTRFDVSDDAATFEGELDMKGPDWKWTGWTYDIKLNGGWKLEGSAAISEEGIFTAKVLRTADGKVFAHVKENLEPISEKEYLEHRLEILKY